ncbi:DUF6545 domain-containing protein [Mycobacterium sp.]|uniref:DUF6545 domain-containing protein n=1 Tax=Mycobacterium sp. TaxID=1785 RepID=UPI003CC51D34
MSLLVFICTVTLGRLIGLRSTVADRRGNTALVFAAMCCVLRDDAIQPILVQWSGQRVSAALLYQLSEHAAGVAACALFLLAYGWVNQHEPRCLALVVYSWVTVCVVVRCVAEMHAHSRDISLDIHSGWAVIAYSSSPAGIVFVELLCVANSWLAILIAVACARELRRPPNRRAAVISAGMTLVAVGSLVQNANISIAACIAATGRHNAYIERLGWADRFSVVLFAYVCAAIAAVPLGARTLERHGLDKYSLRRRPLLPLWRDLTSACPELIYVTTADVVNNRSRFLLHRTVVEIRDCILILSRYASQQNEVIIHELAELPAFRQALRLALAWSAKTTGELPSGDFLAQQSAAAELLDESAELTDLAEHWPTAKALTEAVSQIVAKR